MGADERNTELVIRAKNLTNEAFAAAGGNLTKLRNDAKKAGDDGGNAFGKMEKGLRQFDDVLELAGGPHLRDVIQGVGQLGDVASGASGQLDGLAKAGLVASAALGGWQIGRKIAELAGTDAIIGNATAKLLGWGDAAGQAAAAGADVLARASKNAGRQITDMAEAMRINEEAAKKTIATNQQRSQVILKNLKDEKKAHDDAAKAAEAHAEKISKLADAYSGLDVIAAAKDAVEALHRAQRTGVDITQMTTAQQKALGESVLGAIDVYQRLGKTVPAEWHAIVLATRTATDEQKKDIELVTKALADMEKGLLGIPHNVRMALGAIPSLDVTKGLAGLENIGANVGLPTAPKVSLFAQMFGSSEQFGGDLSKMILGAIQGGGNPVSAAAGMVGTNITKSIATKLTSEGGIHLTGALAGVLNSALPVVGSLIGPIVDKIFGSLFGTKGRDTKLDLAKQFFGSVEEMQRTMVDTLSKADYDRLWAQFSKVGQNNADQAVAAIDAIRAALDKQKRSQDDVAASAKSKADAIADAEKKAADAVASVQKQIDDVDKQLADLDASEAVEENMGLVEKQTRERLGRQKEELQQQLEATKANGEAAVQALKDTATEAFDKMAEAVDRLTDALNGIPKHTNFTVSGTYEGGGYSGGRGDGEMPQHEMGAYIREEQTAHLHANEMVGPVEFFAQAVGRALAANRVGAGGGYDGPERIVVQLNDRVLTEVVLKNQSRVLAGYGAGAR